MKVKCNNVFKSNNPNQEIEGADRESAPFAVADKQ